MDEQDILPLQLENSLRKIVQRLYAASHLLDQTVLDQARQLERLAEQIHQPCVVAIVGQVSVGKSTFMNALLAMDLAKVGVTPTTATINLFHYGRLDSDYPIRCHWKSGRISRENLTFPDLLNDDPQTQHCADRIHYLDYYQEQITLVDTPGTNSTIEAHQKGITTYLSHEDEDVDAVIYLIDTIVFSADQAILSLFQHVTRGQAHAFNAIGILAKVDENPEVLEQRKDLAREAAAQLQESLNTVIPVSAGVQRALDGLLANNQAGLKEMIKDLQALDASTLEVLRKGEKGYSSYRTVSTLPGKWEQWQEKKDWRVFVTIVATIASHLSNQCSQAANHQATDNGSIAKLENDIIAELEEIAGIKHVHDILYRYFIKRGRYLRSYRIVKKVRQALAKLDRDYQFTFYDKATKEANERALLNRVKNIIPTSSSEQATLQELAAFVEQHLFSPPDPKILLEEVLIEFERIESELRDYNEDIVALQRIEEHQALFEKEKTELQKLFGLHFFAIENRVPPDPHYIIKRQSYWNKTISQTNNNIVRAVAIHAARRYGQISRALDKK